MERLNSEQKFRANLFLKICDISYLDERDNILENLRKEFNYDEVYFFDKNNHQKIDNNIFKKILFKIKSKYDLVDLQFIVAIKKALENKRGEVSIIFRGSQEKEDWLTNFSLKFVNHNNFKKSVHSGFYRSFKLFEKSVKSKKDDKELDFLNDIKYINENYDLYLSGHSLGGAIATIAGCHFYDKGINKNNMSIFTYGSPPIAKKELCLYYENSFKIFRFVNKEDPVPEISKLTDLKDIGEKILLNSEKINFHNIDDYKELLKEFKN